MLTGVKDHFALFGWLREGCLLACVKGLACPWGQVVTYRSSLCSKTVLSSCLSAPGLVCANGKEPCLQLGLELALSGSVCLGPIDGFGWEEKEKKMMAAMILEANTFTLDSSRPHRFLSSFLGSGRGGVKCLGAEMAQVVEKGYPTC